MRDVPFSKPLSAYTRQHKTCLKHGRRRTASNNAPHALAAVFLPRARCPPRLVPARRRHRRNRPARDAVVCCHAPVSAGVVCAARVVHRRQVRAARHGAAAGAVPEVCV